MKWRMSKRDGTANERTGIKIDLSSLNEKRAKILFIRIAIILKTYVS